MDSAPTYPPTLWDLVVDGATRLSDVCILADDHGRRLTAAQYREAAERVAAGLVQQGIRPGDVVSWQLPTSLEAMVLLGALARLGAVQNPLIPLLREREVGFITHQVGTKLLIVPEVWRGFDHAAMARDIAGREGFEVLELDFSGLEGGGPLRLPEADPAEVEMPPPPEPGGVRWLYYSSGTTAEPKGARHTDDALMASANGLIHHMGYGPDDVYPIAWPVTHIGGSGMITAALTTGVQLVMFDTFDPNTTPDRMAAHHPTLLGTAVPFFRAYMDAQRRHGDDPLYPDLRVGVCGGAPVPREVHDEVREVLGVPLVNAWGLTEFPNATSATPDDPLDVLVTTAGRPVPGVKVWAVKADGTDAAVGEEGELRLAGPQCMKGYVDPALDVDAFDEQGRFRTGDLGTIDEAGNVTITGRIKEIVIRNAENISVLEIEELLYRHPAIAEAAVIGLPDPRTGERVCAVVVPRPGQTVTLDSLRDHCRKEGLAIQKCPEQLEVVEVLPRNSMGKVLKQQLRAEILG